MQLGAWPLRGLAVLGGCAGATAIGWRLAAHPVADLLGPVVDRGPLALQSMRFDTVIVGLAAAVLLGCVGWLVLTTAVATALELLRGVAPGARAVALLETVVDRWSPVLVRRVVAALLGTAVTAGLAAGPALAAPGRGDGLSGLAIPDRTTGSAGPAPTTAPTTATSPAVVVRTGDCLWSIATDLLAPAASDADVLVASHRLLAANRDRIGPDPDLIVPGTHLVVPDLTVQREEAP